MTTIEVAHVTGWFWRVVANGETMSHSENYYSKSNAVRAARRFSQLTGFDVVVTRPRRSISHRPNLNIGD